MLGAAKKLLEKLMKNMERMLKYIRIQMFLTPGFQGLLLSILIECNCPFYTFLSLFNAIPISQIKVYLELSKVLIYKSPLICQERMRSFD